jgi:hypothetical protein
VSSSGSVVAGAAGGAREVLVAVTAGVQVVELVAWVAALLEVAEEAGLGAGHLRRRRLGWGAGADPPQQAQGGLAAGLAVHEVGLEA